MNKKILLISIFALITQLYMNPLHASPQELKAEALYQEAVSEEGNMKKIKAATQAFSDLLNTGQHPLIYQIRIASLTSVKAKHVWFPNQKMDFCNQSIKSFNDIKKEILKSESPNKAYSYEFYFYRGNTFINYPSFLGKRAIAIQDLEKAYDLSTQLNRPKGELANLYFRLAKIYQEDKQPQKMVQFANLVINTSEKQDIISEAKRMIDNDR